MTARRTVKLKELVYTLLNGDATLQSLLGSTGRVKYGNPENLSEYPCVCFTIPIEPDETYNPDQAIGQANSRLIVQCFSSQASSAQVNDLNDRVYELLHGQHLSNEDIKVFSCYRKNSNERRDPTVNAWITTANYDVSNLSL